MIHLKLVLSRILTLNLEAERPWKASPEKLNDHIHTLNIKVFWNLWGLSSLRPPGAHFHVSYSSESPVSHQRTTSSLKVCFSDINCTDYLIFLHRNTGISLMRECLVLLRQPWTEGCVSCCLLFLKTVSGLFCVCVTGHITHIRS